MDTSDIDPKEVKAFFLSILSRSKGGVLSGSAGCELLTIFQDLQWTELLNYFSDEQLTDLQSKDNLEMKRASDAFFRGLLTKDIQTKSSEIIHYNLLYYKTGNLLNFINNFSNFTMFIQNYDEVEMHNTVLKYFLACVICNKLNECETNIQYIKQNYNAYNYDVYLFMLSVIKGHVFASNSAKEKSKTIAMIFKLTKNIASSFWQVISKRQLSLYFVLTLLTNYNDSVVNNILSQTDTLINDLYTLFPDYFKPLLYLKKCQFNLVFEHLISNQFILGEDAILCVHSEKAVNTIRLNVLKDISSSIKEIHMNTLKEMLCLNNNDEVEDMVNYLINTYNVNLTINDVKNSVCALNGSNEANDAMLECIAVCKRNIAKVLEQILDDTMKGKIGQQELNEFHYDIGGDNNNIQ